MVFRFFILFLLALNTKSFALSKGDLVFHAGFNKISEKPQSAPILPLQMEELKGEPKVDFNNLKDPVFTPTFGLRNPPKYQIPGFSTCFVNRHGAMEIDVDKEHDCVWLRGNTPGVCGYLGKQFLENSPTYFETALARIKPEEGGNIYLHVSDMVSGAFIMVNSFGNADAWAIAWNENGKWEGWKVRVDSLGADWTKSVKLAVGTTAKNEFQVYLNEKPIGPVIRLANLKNLTEIKIGGDAREKGFRVLEVNAWRDPKLAGKDKSIKIITVTPLKQNTFTPSNPYGNGVQVDYSFLGFSDAMNDPELFGELANTLKHLNIKLIRFPGGNSAYFYSIHGPEGMDGLFKLTGYYSIDRSKGFRWADTRQYFKLCKEAGADALYQLNLGFWYDQKTKQAYRIAIQDSNLTWPAPSGGNQSVEPKIRPLEYHLDKFQSALEDAKTIVKWAKEIGVKVIWEFGNEDSAYFCPKTYVQVSKEFYDAVRQVDPKAQFAVYGDGITWSDWDWPYAVFTEMAKAKMDIAYTSNHEYLFGGSGIPLLDGKHTYDGINVAWANIADLRYGVRKKLDELGYKKTRMAITEGNVAATGPMVGQPFEHGMGRGLGEAEIFPSRIKKYAMLVHHDLVRSGPENGTWFCRIFYFPKNPKGRRYKLPVTAEIMAVMGRHALREIIADDQGITVSQWNDGLFVTAGNAFSIDRNITLTFSNFPGSENKIIATCYTCDNLDTPEFKTHELPVTVDRKDGNAVISLSVPKYSFCFFILNNK
jgi:hypothetical protein